MTNLLKVVLFIVTISILIYAVTKIGISQMLIASALFLLIALIAFVVWATRPPKSQHINQLQSFSLTFEGKRIDFKPTADGLYSVNLCTKRIDSLEASKWETSTKDGKTLVYSHLTKKLQREYFTNDITVELGEKRLTEKQALKLHSTLLKASNSQSVVNAVYILNLIESMSKPTFATAKRVKALNVARQNIRAKTNNSNAFNPSSLLSQGQKVGSAAENSTMVLALFAMSSMKSELFNLAANSSFDTLFAFLGLILFVATMYNKFCDYVKNECIQ